MIEKVNFDSVKYYNDPMGDTGILAVIDGVDWYVPEDSNNNLYIEIMRQVKAGELTIADAE